MTKQEFRNLICIIHNINTWELPDHWSEEWKNNFLINPIQMFLRADDERSDKIWEAMQKQMVQK